MTTVAQACMLSSRSRRVAKTPDTTGRTGSARAAGKVGKAMATLVWRWAAIVGVAAAAVAATMMATGCVPKPAGVRFPELPQLPQGALHIIHVDVGQGDGLLILHGGKSLLIDAGSARNNPHEGARRIARRLRALTGTSHLDYFVATHYHQDHVGAAAGGRRKTSQPTGLFALIERYGVTVGLALDHGDWFLGPPTSTYRAYHRSMQDWLRRGLVGERRTLKAGDRIDMGPDVSVEVIVSGGNGYLDQLSATYPTMVSQYPPSENDYSVGVALRFGDFEMFSAGDLGGHDVLRQFGKTLLSYNDLESRIAQQIGAVEVYRVNHHGSANSSNACFAGVLHPQVSVFSTGLNSYGHPSIEVYERLRRLGEVLITGGADRDVQRVVESSIVGDDVEVIVEPGGARFWVNGRPFRSLSDAEEAQRFGPPHACKTDAPADGNHYHPVARRDAGSD